MLRLQFGAAFGEIDRVRIRPALFATCAFLAACGGKVVSGEDTNGSVGGYGGTITSGTTTGGTMTDPGMTEPGIPVPGQTGTAGAFGTGGGSITTPCGVVNCGPGLVCCNPSCGVCTLPGQGCDAIACGVPNFDAGSGPVLDSGPPPVVDVIVGRSDYGNVWKDSWFIRGCSIKAGHDCIGIPNCPNGGAANFEDRGSVVTESFPVGGKVGVIYAVTFQVNGISEGKYYQGGTRDAGETISANLETANLDTFYRGGTPVASSYGVLRMRILDPAGKELARYYMNSGPINSGMESHRTFAISYSKTIDVAGGGYVEYLTQDSNCHSIDNCGPGEVSDTVCNAARGIPNEENNLLPAMGIDPNPANDVIIGKHRSVSLADLNSVNGSNKPWHSQIVHLTITKAVPK